MASTKLYHLWVYKGRVDYDEFDSFVVRARSSKEARTLVQATTVERGRWLDPKQTRCRQLAANGKAEVIIGSFNAG